MKAFASETITCTTVLHEFCKQVLAPQGRLPAVVSVISTLKQLLDLLFIGDRAVAQLPTIARLFRELHVLMLAHCPESIKQKIHYMRHVEDSMSEYLVSVTAFPSERKHRAAKTVAGYTYKNLAQALIAHDIHQMAAVFSDADTFRPIALKDECYVGGNLDMVESFGHVVSCLLYTSPSPRDRG